MKKNNVKIYTCGILHEKDILDTIQFYSEESHVSENIVAMKMKIVPR